MFGRIRRWLSRGWDDDIVIQCPVCWKFIENPNWLKHLATKHRAKTLRQYGIDYELVKHLLGENPEYGKRDPEWEPKIPPIVMENKPER